MRHLILLALLAGSMVSLTQDQQADNKAASKPVPEMVQDHASTTEHSIKINGKTIAYTATAGHLITKKEDGSPLGKFFYIAYIRKDGGEPGTRPLTFSFNGGPGSSSVWLHLGVLGPKVVEMDEEGFPLPPPYRLIDNGYSVLDKTDLVFIDPVGTGYSRPAPGENREQFHGLREDIETVGEFIRLWTTRNARWASPKFLVGESYGTTRAAGLVQYLQSRHDMYFNGVLLVSAILNFQTARFHPGNDLPFITFLPTYAVTAWFHKQLSPEMQALSIEEVAAQARAFAVGDYAAALVKGSRLGADERKKVRARLAALTGLSETYLDETNLRINIRRFAKELRRDEGKTVGRLDSRFVGFDRDNAGERYEYDPSMAAIAGPYSATLKDYVRRTLGYESDTVYNILGGGISRWNYESATNQYANLAEDLRRAMTENQDLKVFLACGYYDLATPFFAAEYTFAQMMLDPSLKKNVTTTYYPAGHMMYIQKSSLVQMKKDLDAFYDDATSKE